MYYLKTRDDLTRTTLLSPARWYTEKMLHAHVDNIRKRKLLEEAEDNEKNKKSETLGPKAVSLLVFFTEVKMQTEILISHSI